MASFSLNLERDLQYLFKICVLIVCRQCCRRIRMGALIAPVRVEIWVAFDVFGGSMLWGVGCWG